MKLSSIETTFIDNKKNIVKSEHKMIEDPGIENQVVNIYPQVTDQTFLGFGGALTDSAGYVYSLMDSRQKAELLEAYFNPQKMNYSTLRIPIDSCDFSLEHYEAMSDPKDTLLKSFSLERAGKYIFPFLDDIQRARGKPVEIMVSPWSPPKFMKTNQERNHGGKLLPEYRQMWASYICRYIKEFRSRGYLVTRMTIQNEPKAVQRWDSCIYTGEDEKEFLRDYLVATLNREGLSDIGVYIWDHNKERVLERSLEVLDEVTDKMVQGIAFHWYSGDHFEALNLVHRHFPNKILASSEACNGFSDDLTDSVESAQKYAHEIIGNLNGGMQLFYDWNLILDEQGGPNHAKNYCDAPFLYDSQEKKLMERKAMAYIGHFSHFIKPGAVRIETSRYTQDIETTAFKNVDGKIAIVFLNRIFKSLDINIRMNGLFTKILIHPGSIMTAIMDEI